MGFKSYQTVFLSGFKIFLTGIFFSLSLAGETADSHYERAMMVMLEEIKRDVHATKRETARAELAALTWQALKKVPRHKFVPENLVKHAYDNRPLPIGYGQTISQPYIVALMTDLLDLQPGKGRVLEIGTGSGYQAAVLSFIAQEVYTIEIIDALGESVKKRLADLGYQNISVRTGDGYYGWEDKAPFDAIIVTAAATHVPPPLLKQLKTGGRMIIPVGGPFQVQYLTRLIKTSEGVRSEEILPVQFVPFTGNRK